MKKFTLISQMSNRKVLACRDPIYLISDIHSNYPALQAALEEIPNTATIICAGDIVGYYTEPNEVCKLLRSRSCICIKGNHDKYVLGDLNYPESREAKYRIQSNRDQMSHQNMEWLANLPDFIMVDFENISSFSEKNNTQLSLHIFHGSPTSVEEYIYPDTPIDFLADYPATHIVLGHTHHPMHRHSGALQVINPGSIGQARDRKPSASYARFCPLSKAVDFYRADYAISEYQEKLKTSGIDQTMIDILSRTSL